MSKGRVLVVEDETITALDIQQSLWRRGYAVPQIACSGAEALNLARQEPPDLVLMDIRLKGEMDGIEAARQIRHEFNTPVVFLTAYEDAPTLERAKTAEPFAYLLKPFEEVVLATSIEMAIHKHYTHERLLRQTFEALRTSDERFERLLASISDFAIVLLDPTGRICSWNPGAEQSYGWSAAEALEKDVAILYPANEVAGGKVEQDLQRAARTGQLAEYGSQVHRGHRAFTAKTVLISLHDSAGKVTGFLRVTRALAPGGNHN